MQTFQVFFPSRLPFLILFHNNIHICSSPTSIHCLINTQPGRACKSSSISDYIPFTKQRTGQKCYFLSSLTSTFLVSKEVKLVSDKTRYRMQFPDTWVQLHPPEQTNTPMTTRIVGFTEVLVFQTNLCDFGKKQQKKKVRNFALQRSPWGWLSLAVVVTCCRPCTREVHCHSFSSAAWVSPRALRQPSCGWHMLPLEDDETRFALPLSPYSHFRKCSGATMKDHKILQ